jgi:3-oxoacyl-[acyl-carrier-protein] synthase II
MHKEVLLLAVVAALCSFTLGLVGSTGSLLKRGVSGLRMAKGETIVVTGLGIISPSGSGATEFFDNICAGVSGVSRLTRFDPEAYKCQIAAQVKDFNPKDHYKSRKKIKQNDLSCHYAVAASHMALADAGLDLSAEGIEGERCGVIVGSAFGGMMSFEEAANDLKEYGPSSINPYTIPMMLGNTPAGIIAMETGAKGPNFGVQTACATATHAFGEVSRVV